MEWAGHMAGGVTGCRCLIMEFITAGATPRPIFVFLRLSCWAGIEKSEDTTVGIYLSFTFAAKASFTGL